MIANKVRVILVSPRFPMPKTDGGMVWVSGIETETRARAWGEKYGYLTVWWWKQRARAYAKKEKG